MRIGLLTGGGDAPGLNAVIYAFTRAALSQIKNCSIVGYKFGYRGLYHNDFIRLTPESTSGLLHRGGTVLYSSNKDNLFKYPFEENGQTVIRDVSYVAVDNLKKEFIDVLVVLGGDGTLTSARDFSNMGVKVIGIPKTIDNDLASTETTFGFDTAVNIVTENLGRLHTTAESHHRVFVVEVMGRYAGWIALHSGIAGSADVILLPELPYSLDKIVEKIRWRDQNGRPFTIIVCGEGATEAGGSQVVREIVHDSPDQIRLGGVAAYIAQQLTPLVNHEVRSVQLGHIQRGGETSPADRVLSCRYAIKAVEMIKNKEFGRMVTLNGGTMGSKPLNEVLENNKYVTKDNELIKVAKMMGITFAEADELEGLSSDMEL